MYHFFKNCSLSFSLTNLSLFSPNWERKDASVGSMDAIEENGMYTNNILTGQIEILT